MFFCSRMIPYFEKNKKIKKNWMIQSLILLSLKDPCLWTNGWMDDSVTHLQSHWFRSWVKQGSWINLLMNESMTPSQRQPIESIRILNSLNERFSDSFCSPWRLEWMIDVRVRFVWMWTLSSELGCAPANRTRVHLKRVVWGPVQVNSGTVRC